MDIGRKKISEDEYSAYLKKLLLCMEGIPIHGIVIYNIVYDLISSKPSYETRLYVDLCHFFSSRINPQSTEYLEEFKAYKKIVFALSSLCPLLHEALGRSHRPLEEIAFLIWEKAMLRNRDIGAWLVSKIESGITAERLFGYKSLSNIEVSKICQNVHVDDKESIYNSVIKVIEAEGDGVLKDCHIEEGFCIPARSSRAALSTQVKNPGHFRRGFGAEDGASNCTSLLTSNLGGSSGTSGPAGSQKRGPEAMRISRSIEDNSCPFKITYENIRSYIDTLSYIVSDPSSPLLYYTAVYEIRALEKIACEASIDDVSFENYTSFACLKLFSETRRMHLIFLESSCHKVVKVLDWVLVERKAGWLQEMFKTVMEEPLLLKRHFTRLRLFPSFRIIFGDIFKEFLISSIESRAKRDLETMYRVLTSLTEYTSKYMSREWIYFLKETFSKYLNEIKGIDDIFVDFCDRALRESIALGYLVSEEPSCGKKHPKRHIEEYGSPGDMRTSPYIPKDWKVFDDLFAFLASRSDFSEKYILRLQDRLLGHSPNLAAEKAFLGLLFAGGCSGSFRRKVESMIEDIEISREYLFRHSGGSVEDLGDKSTVQGRLSGFSVENISTKHSLTMNFENASEKQMGRYSSFLESRKERHKEGDTDDVCNPLFFGVSEHLPQEKVEFSLVKPYILNSGNWVFESQDVRVSPHLMNVLSFFESKYRKDFNMRHFNWVHNKSAIIIDLFLRKRVRVELNTFQYSILDCLKRSCTLKDIVSMCKASEQSVSETIDLFLKTELVIPLLPRDKSGETPDPYLDKMDTAAAENRYSDDIQSASQQYVINMDFDKEFLKIPQGPKTQNPKKIVDIKQRYMSLICSLMKKRKTLSLKDILQETKISDTSIFEEALRDCVNQGYIEGQGDNYEYVP